MTFLLGFKMVPSLTCRVEPEVGDVRMGPAQKTGPGMGGGGGHLGLGGWNKARPRPSH